MKNYTPTIRQLFKEFFKTIEKTDYKLPTHYQLELTDKCNLYCQYCYRFDTDKTRKSFDLDERRIMAIAKKIVKAGGYNVTLTGGEPFARKNLLKKLVKYFKSKNVRIGLISNALLVDEQIISELIELGHNSMLVSCPSSDPETYKIITGGGDFEVLKEKLRLLQNLKFDFSINMVVTKQNIMQIRETATFFKEFGIRKIAITPMVLNADAPRKDLVLTTEEIGNVVKELVWIQDNLGLYVATNNPLPLCAIPKEIVQKDYEFLRKSCQAGRCLVAISSTGEVRPCPHISKSYGNILKEPLNKIHAKMKEWHDRFVVPTECNQCKLLNKCEGACRANAIGHDGNISGKGPWFVEPLDYTIPQTIPQSNPKTKISLNKNTLLLFPTQFIWRQVDEDNYILMMDKEIKYVDKKLLELIKVLKEILPLRIYEVASFFRVSPDNAEFLNDIHSLCRKQIIRIKNDNFQKIS